MGYVSSLGGTPPNLPNILSELILCRHAHTIPPFPPQVELCLETLYRSYIWVNINMPIGEYLGNKHHAKGYKLPRVPHILPLSEEMATRYIIYDPCESIKVTYCWWFRNPARKPVEVGSLSHSLQVFFILGGARPISFWTINSDSHIWVHWVEDPAWTCASARCSTRSNTFCLRKFTSNEPRKIPSYFPLKLGYVIGLL